MYKKLQLKFILVSVLSALLVIVVLLGTINLVNYKNTVSELDNLSTMIAKQEGIFANVVDGIPPYPFDKNGTGKRYPTITEETEFQTRYFTVSVNSYNQAVIYREKIAAITSDEMAIQYVYNVRNTNHTSGFIDNYYFSVNVVNGNRVYCFLDSSQQLEQFSNLITISSIVATISLLLVAGFASVFSKKVVTPFAENQKKQKQFITDASHELKTPLSVISADVDVLKLTGEENEWVDSIQNQTKKLTKLVNNLVQLAKLDEGRLVISKEKFSLTDAIEDIIPNYEKMYLSQGKTFNKNIQTDVFIVGDETYIRQLLTILLDNAGKYTDDNGSIGVELSQQNKGAVVKVFNTCVEMKREHLNKLFDRFYRVDSSRSEVSGYGIGLSMAKSIAEASNATITASTSDEKSICFTIKF